MAKRRIPLNIILGITVNKLTDEFVIHGLDIEYDYYYTSHRRNEILAIINAAYNKLSLPKFKFSVLNEKSLKSYVTNKKDKKSNPSFTRMKTDHLSSIDDFLSQKIIPKGEKNLNGVVGPQFDSNTVYSTHKNVKKVKLEDFKVLKVIGRGSFGKVCLVEYLPTH